MEDLGKTSTGIQPNVAGLLSYAVGIITGIIFFLIEKENKFVRFHAMQSLITFGALIVLSVIIGAMPGIRILYPLVNLAGLIIWIVCMVKAYQGEMFKLPVVGDIAEKQISGSSGSNSSGGSSNAGGSSSSTNSGASHPTA